jgi:hypothetical protein
LFTGAAEEVMNEARGLWTASRAGLGAPLRGSRPGSRLVLGITPRVKGAEEKKANLKQASEKLKDTTRK